MTINYDCIRDLLRTLEDILVFDDNLSFPLIELDQILKHPYIKKYSKVEIVYSTLMLQESDYIECEIIASDSNILGIQYTSISFEGHQFLDSIRSNEVWSDLKKKAASLTFDLIKILAADLIKSSFI